MGQDQVSGGVSVPCQHATPVENVQNSIKLAVYSVYQVYTEFVLAQKDGHFSIF